MCLSSLSIDGHSEHPYFVHIKRRGDIQQHCSDAGVKISVGLAALLHLWWSWKPLPTLWWIDACFQTYERYPCVSLESESPYASSQCPQCKQLYYSVGRGVYRVLTGAYSVLSSMHGVSSVQNGGYRVISMDSVNTIGYSKWLHVYRCVLYKLQLHYLERFEYFRLLLCMLIELLWNELYK